MRSPLALLLAVVLAAYLFLPLIWPEPSVAALFLPSDRDPLVVVSVGAWHSNVRISGASFCVALDAPNSQGQSFVCPKALFSGPGGGTGIVPFWALNRLTFPRKEELRLKLPLAKLIHEGSIGPGRVHGWIAVDVIHAKVERQRLGAPFGYVERSMTVRVPFDVRTHE